MPTLDTTKRRTAEARKRRGCSKTALYRDIKNGLFPPPITKGRRFAFWPEYELDALARAEIASATDEQLRALVRRLVKARAKLMPEISAEGENAAA